MDGNEMPLKHQQLKAYLSIIRDSPVYPVVIDADRVVRSLPPIINGEHLRRWRSRWRENPVTRLEKQST